MELGLGIHGEPGARTVPLQPVDIIVTQVIAPPAAIMSAHPLPSVICPTLLPHPQYP